MKRIVLISVVLIGILSVISINCKKDEIPVATSIELVAGGDQSAIIGSMLPELIEVLVKDQDGNPYAGATVNFTTIDGSITIATVLTNVEGKTATIWTLGETAETQSLTVIAYEADGTTHLSGSPITVNATAEAEPLEAESIEISSGNGQSGEIETELTNPVEVLVKDINGDVVFGVTVNFTVTEGSVSYATATTDTNGKASVNWTLGSTFDSQTLNVTAFKLDGFTSLTGSPLTFTATGTTPLVTDYDGNTYNTVGIGDQIWMAEDLKVTHFPDGTPITNVTSNSIWGDYDFTAKRYCFYNNNSNTDYGALYTGIAAMNGEGNSSANPSGVQGVCPDGWHIPSASEWDQLVSYLGGINVAGGKLKETGTTHWNSPNTSATNESGFTALPGGRRLFDGGAFAGLGESGSWWTTTEDEYGGSIIMILSYDNDDVSISGAYSPSGKSVRCVMD